MLEQIYLFSFKKLALLEIWSGRIGMIIIHSVLPNITKFLFSGYFLV